MELLPLGKKSEDLPATNNRPSLAEQHWQDASGTRHCYHLSMKHHWLTIAAVVVAGVLLALRWGMNTTHRNREELPAIPGAVAYTEGTSQVSHLFDNAKELLASNQIAEAEGVYREIIEIEPNNALGYIGLGSCLLMQDALEAARKQYTTASQLDPRSSQAFIGLASTFHRQRQFAAAIENYQSALRIDDNLPDAHLGLALSHDQLGQRKLATQQYQRFLELAPQSTRAAQVIDRIAELNLPQVGNP